MLLGSRSLLNQVAESLQMMITAVRQLEADSSHKNAELCVPPNRYGLLRTELLAHAFLASAESSMGPEQNFRHMPSSTRLAVGNLGRNISAVCFQCRTLDCSVKPNGLFAMADTITPPSQITLL